MSNRVVITGMGIWSCIGTDIETVKQSLYEGKSGIGLDNDRLIYGYRSGLKGIVETPVITKQMLDRLLQSLLLNLPRSWTRNMIQRCWVMVKFSNR